MARIHKATRVDPRSGEPPSLATVNDYQGSNEKPRGRGVTDRMPKEKGRINLKAVAEACVEEGLDPAVEILRVLAMKVPVLDRSGQPVLGDDGKVMMVDRVDPDTRLRTLNELLNYTQPKLKAVEVKMSGSLDLTSEQLDQRLGALLAKAQR